MPEATIARFKQLTEVLLPELARAQNWPLRLDHCFKRICLDAAFSDAWDRHLARPAERHLHGAALISAVAAAEDLLATGRPTLDQLQQQSLHYRRQTPQQPLFP